MDIIEVKGVRKKYGALEVLKGIDLVIQEKEVVSIVGASGAGKTTLLQIIGTLDTPDEGKVIYKLPGENANGIQVDKMSMDSLANFRNKNIGFVFQFHHLLPEFTAIENVCIPGLIAKKNKQELEQDASEILNFLGLGSRLNHKPSELSGGEQQRVAVARAMINRPGIIFADEPSGNLDSHTADDLHHLFFELREKYGQTIVIVTHNRELAKMSDRTITMKDGLIESYQ